MTKNKVVSFDLDGTLTDPHFVDSVWLEGIPRLYSIKNRVSFNEAKEAVMKEYNKVGKEELQWYDIHYWINHFNLDIDWKNLFSKYENRIRIYPDVTKSLKELTRKGIKLIIITNASTEFLEFQLAKTSIGNYFKALFSATSDFGLVKKTIKVYQKVCNNLNILPHELIHIGDDRHFDFDVPRRLGIQAFHLDRTGTYKEEHVVHNLNDIDKKLISSLC